MSSKRIFLTGVSRGLGRAMAEHFLAEGHTVLGCSRTAPAGWTEAVPDGFTFLPIDLGNAAEGRARLNAALKEGRGFDLAILNAGVLPPIRDLRETPLETLRETMEVNVWANKWIIDALLGMPQRPPQVVAISSGAAVSGARGWNGYALSKAALNMLVRLYAAEAPDVHFTAFAPGLIDTAMQDYLCGLEDDDRFETVRRLKAARGSEAMPSPPEAAARIARALPNLLAYESGAFVDIRKMGS